MDFFLPAKDEVFTRLGGMFGLNIFLAGDGAESDSDSLILD